MASLDLVEQQMYSALHLKLLKPDRNYIPALTSGVNHARLILFILTEAGHDGLTASDLAKKAGLNKNTCLIYLRWLRRNNLISRSVQQQGNIVSWIIKAGNQNPR